MTRLERSLKILVQLNTARRLAFNRIAGARRTVRSLEAALEQNDADGRARADARQLSLFTSAASPLN